MNENETNSIRLTGFPASPGIVIGEAFVVERADPSVVRRTPVTGDIEREVCRFQDAIEQTRAQILELKGRLGRTLGEREARIFDAHLLVLDDVLAIDRTLQRIREERVSAEYAVSTSISEVIDTLMEVEDDYLRERAEDIKDVRNRILHNLTGVREGHGLHDLRKRCIVVARELSPSMTARADRHQLLGFVTELSGTTSHAAILAQSFEIPAVVGLSESTLHIDTGDRVIVDGTSGVVIVRPTDAEIDEYEARIRKFREFENELALLKDLPASTVDGYRIALTANMEFPEELLSVLSHGAEGIGLFRTEYLFLTRAEMPTEEEQFEIFRDILAGMRPRPVVIRTFDIGADKHSDLFEIPEEKNPFLGWRGVRLALDSEEVFVSHLRALLRASPHGNLHLMFPMVNSVEELRDIYAILDREEKELRREGHEVDAGYRKGVMIETPSSVMLADLLADEVDFFSIGTNDLIQYLLAVDRGNERVAHMYDPFHPAVIRSIRDVLARAKNRRRWVGVCGEMAAHLSSALLLIGLGVDELSASPILVPKIKSLIRNITITEARDLAAEALEMRTAEEIRNLYDSVVAKRFEIF